MMRRICLLGALLGPGCAPSADFVGPTASSVPADSAADLQAWLASGALERTDWAQLYRSVEGGLPPGWNADLPLSSSEQGFLNTALQAYLWGFGPMTVYRLQQEKTNTQAPLNQFYHPTHLADWQQPSPVSAPNMDVLYSSAFLALSAGPQILTIPSLSGYYVVQIDDLYGNSNASLGARTVPGSSGGRYLLVGPDDPGYLDPSAYANQGFDSSHVIPVDTPHAWMVVRVPVNPYAVVGAPADLTSSESYQQSLGFTLAPLSTSPPSGSPDPRIADLYASPPATGREFFTWLGQTVAANPLPARAAFSNRILPPYLMSPSPSVGQAELFASFARIGLDAGGFHPERLNARELVLLEIAARAGQLVLQAGQAALSDGPAAQNHWHVTGTSAIGKYPNSWSGWLVRSVAGLEGGIASLAVDGTYPLTAHEIQGARLEGGRSYRLRFAPGSLPPLASPGFWSLTVYSEVSASGNQTNTPAVAQAGVNNVAYSAPASLNVTVVDASHFQGTFLNNDTLFFPRAPAGLRSDTPYFVINREPSGRFQLAATWNPEISRMLPVSVETRSVGTTHSGGLVNPVHSLGSQQLPGSGSVALSGQTLRLGSDGSLEILLQNQAPADRGEWGNWLPIPQSGGFQVMTRLYHPLPATPQSGQPSILSTTTIPLTTSSAALAQRYPQEPIDSSNRYGTYVVPGITQVGNARKLANPPR